MVCEKKEDPRTLKTVCSIVQCTYVQFDAQRWTHGHIECERERNDDDDTSTHSNNQQHKTSSLIIYGTSQSIYGTSQIIHSKHTTHAIQRMAQSSTAGIANHSRAIPPRRPPQMISIINVCKIKKVCALLYSRKLSFCTFRLGSLPGIRVFDGRS
jgi:hypothetical protein